MSSTPCPNNSLSSYSRLITFGAQLHCVDIKFAHFVLCVQNEAKATLRSDKNCIFGQVQSKANFPVAAFLFVLST